jgi:hypothetical protein
MPTQKVMGFASLYPSYELTGPAPVFRCLRWRSASISSERMDDR